MNQTYVLAISGAHELLENCGSVPRSIDERGILIAHVEKILFGKENIPSEFRQLSDLYIARGISGLH